MYATCDTVQAHQSAGRPEALIGAAGTLIVNAGEAALVTGQNDPEEAAVSLARLVATAIVTLGADGAVAVSGGIVAHAEAPRQSARALIGAGDVFAAAYVWADLAGSPLAERLALACLYASLSLRAPSVLRGALSCASSCVPPTRTACRCRPRRRTEPERASAHACLRCRVRERS